MALTYSWGFSVQKILLTGATGFVGGALAEALLNRHFEIVCAGRRSSPRIHFAHGDLGADTKWHPALQGCQTVVHLAARVHQMADASKPVRSAYRHMNVDVTMNLARQAVQAGVARFVFVSSIKVNGESSRDLPFTAEDLAAPQDAYGESKLEAERGLLALGQDAGMEIVIVRPPLVYGPGVRANFLRLMQLVKAGVPLPLASIRSKRSLVGIDNLVDFLTLCTSHPATPGKVWLVSDQQDLTIGELIGLIASAMDRPARLFPMPPSLLKNAARFLGKASAGGRLLDPLCVDATPASILLGWKPPVAPDEGIRRTVRQFLLQSP